MGCYCGKWLKMRGFGDFEVMGGRRSDLSASGSGIYRIYHNYPAECRTDRKKNTEGSKSTSEKQQKCL